MKAEGSQLTLTLVPHSLLSFACVAVCPNRWHVALTLFFFAPRFTSLMLNEWSGWTRWGALNSSWWGHLLWAASLPSKLCGTSLRKLPNYYSVAQLYQCLYWSVESLKCGVPLRLRANMILVDTSLINSILRSETKKKKQAFVCIYGYTVCVCFCYYFSKRSSIFSHQKGSQTALKVMLPSAGVVNLSKPNSWTCKLTSSDYPLFWFF